MPDPVKPIELNYQSPDSVGPPVKSVSSAMVFAMSSVLVIMLPPLSLIFAIVAMWQGIREKKESTRDRRRGGTVAVVAILIASLVLCIDGLIALMMVSSLGF